jgi:hypothetical protein
MTDTLLRGLLDSIAKNNDVLVGSDTSSYSEYSNSASGPSGHAALAKSSGYGHSGSTALDKSSGYGGHSGGYDDHKEEECCPIVVDLICLAAILGALAAATVLLGRVIQIEITGRKKRSFMSFVDNVTYPSWLVSGESSGNIFSR